MEEEELLGKQIYITNGMGRCGKDTFAKFLDDIVRTLRYSSIDKVKYIAKLCGCDGGKTEKDRKFLSDLKLLTTEYSNMAFEAIKSKVNEFLEDSKHVVMLIDIREPAEIEKAKTAFGAKTILIENKNVKTISSNMADANVFNHTYDYTVKNNGTLDDFKENVKEFVSTVIQNGKE